MGGRETNEVSLVDDSSLGRSQESARGHQGPGIFGTGLHEALGF